MNIPKKIKLTPEELYRAVLDGCKYVGEDGVDVDRYIANVAALKAYKQGLEEVRKVLTTILMTASDWQGLHRLLMDYVEDLEKLEPLKEKADE